MLKFRYLGALLVGLSLICGTEAFSKGAHKHNSDKGRSSKVSRKQRRYEPVLVPDQITTHVIGNPNRVPFRSTVTYPTAKEAPENIRAGLQKAMGIAISDTDTLVVNYGIAGINQPLLDAAIAVAGTPDAENGTVALTKTTKKVQLVEKGKGKKRAQARKSGKSKSAKKSGKSKSSKKHEKRSKRSKRR